MGAQSSKKSYNLEIPAISGNFELCDSTKKKTLLVSDLTSHDCSHGSVQHFTANRGGCLGHRHIASLVGFLSFFLLTAIRLALGVGIVAMVKHRQTNQSSSLNESEISCPFPSAPSKPIAGSNFQGEFDWSTELQGYVLGIAFVSFLITLIPGGRFADSGGSKPLLVISNAVSGILTIVSPFAARWHAYALMTVLFLRGASQGFTTPAVYKLMSNWIPINERGTFSTLMSCGMPTGAAVGGIVTGWLCDIPGLGWPSAFYIWGTINVALALVIHLIFYEHPANHPYITDEELKYINDGLETQVSEKHPPTPWKKIFTSVPSYAYFYGLFGQYWSVNYFVSVHPTFMGTILHYPMTKNGITSCLPLLMKIVGGVLASIVSYWITKKNLIGINKLRKLITGIATLGFSLSMAGIQVAGCDTLINILCIVLCLFFAGTALSGVLIAGVDMAPRFAGSFMGVATSIANWSCVLIPVVAGFITTHETLSEWRILFWINLGVFGSSGLVYIIFGSADVQSWNYLEGESTEEITTEKEGIERKKRRPRTDASFEVSVI